MGIHRWTTEEIDFLRENIEGRRYRELTEMFNNHFGLNLGLAQIRSVANYHSLYNGYYHVPIKREKSYTDEQIKYLSDNLKEHTRKELTDMFNEHFNAHANLKRIAYILQKEGISRGEGPARFKKGYIPTHKKPIGSEKIKKDGRIMVKTSEPNTWCPKHRVVWEAVNGPIPKDHNIIFGDGDKQNFDIDNLLLVTNKQRIIMDRRNLRCANRALTETGIVIANMYIKINELRKKENAYE